MRQRLIMLIQTFLFFLIESMVLIALKKHRERDYMLAVSVYMATWLIYTLIEIKFKMFLNNYIRGLVLLMIISSSFFGYYLNFYVSFPLYDRIHHFIGTYAYTLFLYSLVHQIIEIPSFSSRFLFIASLGISLGALFEMIEFITDMLFNPSTPAQPSLRDTNLDLLSNVLGSIFAGFHLVFKPIRIASLKIK